MNTLLCYVSGHGFGHAARMAEILRVLVKGCPDWRVFVRTSAPAELFRGLPASRVTVLPASIDTTVVEKNAALEIDAVATVEEMVKTLARRDTICTDECEFARNCNASAIVADIPFLAGIIGTKVGIPCIGIGNFTWDWIYEPLLQGRSDAASILAQIRYGYEAMSLFVRLPFSHPMLLDVRTVSVPLVASRSQRSAIEVLRDLGITPGEARPKVLIATRGFSARETVARVAHMSPDMLFLSLSAVEGMPENVRSVVLSDRLSFADVLSVSEIAVSKLGYGVLAACIASGTRILFPPRQGFREDSLLRDGARQFATAMEIPSCAFFSGDWSSYLKRLQKLPLPKSALELNGADECAALIAQAVRRE